MSANGQLKDSELASITGGGRLRTDAALAWNGFAKYMKDVHGFDVQVNDSYRPLGRPGDLKRGVWSQWAAWERYQAGGNLAADPRGGGTSNHGLGLALDLAPATIDMVHKYGAGWGFDKRTSDAPSELWHFKWNGYIRPDLKAKWCTPGQPVLKPGDVGPAVLQMKSRLKAWGAWPRAWRIDNKYAGRTPIAVRAFQKAHRLPADGVVGPATWKALLAKPVKPASKPIVKPKPVAPSPAPRPKPVQVRPVPASPKTRYFADLYEGDTFNATEYAKACDLVVLKATEGRTFTDRTYVKRVADARAAGLIVFSYHFARPSTNQPEDEARNFARAVKEAGTRTTDRLVLDWEDPKFEGHSGDVWVERFIKEMGRQSLTVRVLYSGGWYLPGTLGKWPVDHTGNPLRYWHANYGSNPEGTVPDIAKPHLWAVQFTSNQHSEPVHRLPGVNAGDVNYLK